MTHIILMKLRVNDASKGKPTSSRKLSRWLTCSFIEDRFKLTWSFNDWSSVLKLSSFLALWKRIIKLEIINWINLALKINILNISLDLFMLPFFLTSHQVDYLLYERLLISERKLTMDKFLIDRVVIQDDSKYIYNDFGIFFYLYEKIVFETYKGLFHKNFLVNQASNARLLYNKHLLISLMLSLNLLYNILDLHLLIYHY